MALIQGFRIGMKLEAEDKTNGLVCVATVADVDLGKLRIHFDGWEDEYDFWCSPWASTIHEPGWCQERETALSPPKGESLDAGWCQERETALSPPKGESLDAGWCQERETALSSQKVCQQPGYVLLMSCFTLRYE